MSHAPEDHPAWAAVRAVQATHGRELMLRFGAHGLDIVWVDTPDGRVPGLVLHVADAGDRKSVPDLPDTIEVEAADGPVVIPLRVIEAPPTTFESSGDSSG